MLVMLSLMVFADNLNGPAITITMVDDAMVGWLAGLRAPGLLPAMERLAALGSYLAITGLLWGLLLVLLIRRRLRHLLVVLLAWIVQAVMLQILLSPLL